MALFSPAVAGIRAPRLFDDFASVAAWTDNDSGSGDSTQATYLNESCLKLLTAATGGAAKRTLTTPPVIPDKCAVEVRINCDLIATVPFSDFFVLWIGNAANTKLLNAQFGTDGLFVFDGATANEAGTNIVTLDQWDVFQFIIDFANTTVDVYRNGALAAAGLSLQVVGVGANMVRMYQQNTTTANLITYVDYITLD